MKNWNLLMTKPKEDDRAETNLLNQDYELFRPMIRQFKVKKGKQVAVIEALFPGYLFIRLDDVLGNWSQIRSTRGVSKLVRFTELPAIVPDTLIAALQGQCFEGNIIDTTEERPFVYNKGDEIEITEGSFRGITAIIKEQLAEDRVLLLLTLLGKEQELEISLNQVKSTT